MANRIGATFQFVDNLDAYNPMSVSKKQLKEWVDEGVVQHRGRVDHPNMPEIYQASTIVCQLSYREGPLRALLEASSATRPFVLFEVLGCREIIRSGMKEFTVLIGDIKQLENVIIKLIDDPERRSQLGQVG